MNSQSSIPSSLNPESSFLQVSTIPEDIPTTPGLTYDGASSNGSSIGTSVPGKAVLHFQRQVRVDPNDDHEWIADPEYQMEEYPVIHPKEDLIFHKKRTDKAERLAKQERASFMRACKEELRRIKKDNEEYAISHQRGEPKPPSMNGPYQYLYDNINDCLREYTVHYFLRYALMLYLLGDFDGAEDRAKKALTSAEELDYAPLLALCHFHIGKAQSRPYRWDDAVKSFEKAKDARGVYIHGDDLDRAARANMEFRGMQSSEMSVRSAS